MTLNSRPLSGARHLGVLVAAAVFVMFPELAMAQQSGDDPKNAVYYEIGGSGGLFSINYEREIVDRVSARVGFASWTSESFFGGGEVSVKTVPITLQTLLGSGRHRLELGGGILLGNIARAYLPGRFTSLSGIVGYRYQRRGRGFLFRAAATPFYGLGDEDVAYPEKGGFLSVGISFGYAF